MEYRMLAITITLKMTVAIPAISMVNARFRSNGMRHFCGCRATAALIYVKKVG
jgi:hypothetical protein